MRNFPKEVTQKIKKVKVKRLEFLNKNDSIKKFGFGF